jgi:hypothetical protein
MRGQVDFYQPFDMTKKELQELRYFTVGEKLRHVMVTERKRFKEQATRAGIYIDPGLEQVIYLSLMTNSNLLSMGPQATGKSDLFYEVIRQMMPADYMMAGCKFGCHPAKPICDPCKTERKDVMDGKRKSIEVKLVPGSAYCTWIGARTGYNEDTLFGVHDYESSGMFDFNKFKPGELTVAYGVFGIDDFTQLLGFEEFTHFLEGKLPVTRKAGRLQQEIPIDVWVYLTGNPTEKFHKLVRARDAFFSRVEMGAARYPKTIDEQLEIVSNHVEYKHRPSNQKTPNVLKTPSIPNSDVLIDKHDFNDKFIVAYGASLRNTLDSQKLFTYDSRRMVSVLQYYKVLSTMGISMEPLDIARLIATQVYQRFMYTEHLDKIPKLILLSVNEACRQVYCENLSGRSKLKKGTNSEKLEKFLNEVDKDRQFTNMSRLSEMLFGVDINKTDGKDEKKLNISEPVLPTRWF